MAELNFSFDAKGWIKAYNKGIEDGFILTQDYSDLNELININKIEYGKDEEA